MVTQRAGVATDESKEPSGLPLAAERPTTTGLSAATRRRLREFATEADALKGEKDVKLTELVTVLKGLLKDGFHPIVFCRFIPTAEYVGEELRERLPQKVHVEVVTGRAARPCAR